MTTRLRALFLRWSRHSCRHVPPYVPVQYDMPCPCGWHVTGVMYAPTDGELATGIGPRLRPQNLSGPLKTLLDHYDRCPPGRPVKT